MRRKRVTPSKKVHAFRSQLFLLLLVGIAVLTGGAYIWQQQKLTDQKINSADGGKKLDNPERGWYVLLGYQAESKESREVTLENFETACKQIRLDKDRLVEYQIQIRKPGSENRAIADKDLAIIRAEFELMKQYGIQAIVRPVYDWNGKEGKEPDKLETILMHINQLGSIFGDYDSMILCIEAGLLGPNGEWHHSKYLSTGNMRKILDTYLRATPETMQISIRRPEYYREIFETEQPMDGVNVQRGEDKGRIGFHNDGYLGSKDDLGTYTQWSREKELDFQNVHNQFLCFGGEATMLSKYGELFNAIQDMEQTHCTYLNREHYLPLKEQWKETLYTGERASDPAYKKRTGYDYIQDHLGYRYVLQISKIQQGVWSGNSFQGEFTVWNSGFGNMIKPKDTSMILVKGQEQIEIPVDIDVREWKRGLRDETYEILIPKGTDSGTWNVYLSIKSGDIPIQWGNKLGYSSSIGGISLGTISVY